jgi:hypothetical protein
MQSIRRKPVAALLRHSQITQAQGNAIDSTFPLLNRYIAMLRHLLSRPLKVFRCVSGKFQPT